MKRTLSLLTFAFLVTGAAEARWQGLPPLESAEAAPTSAAMPAVVTRLHLRSGVLTILAGTEQPLYSFVGVDGRRLEAQPIEGLVAFDRTLGDLITRSSAMGLAAPFMDASVDRAVSFGDR